MTPTPPTTTFTCTICGEPSSSLCVHCTRDTCPNHLCAKCRRCSDHGCSNERRLVAVSETASG